MSLEKLRQYIKNTDPKDLYAPDDRGKNIFDKIAAVIDKSILDRIRVELFSISAEKEVKEVKEIVEVLVLLKNKDVKLFFSEHRIPDWFFKSPPSSKSAVSPTAKFNAVAATSGGQAFGSTVASAPSSKKAKKSLILSNSFFDVDEGGDRLSVLRERIKKINKLRERDFDVYYKRADGDFNLLNTDLAKPDIANIETFNDNDYEKFCNQFHAIARDDTAILDINKSHELNTLFYGRYQYFSESFDVSGILQYSPLRVAAELGDVGKVKVILNRHPGSLQGDVDAMGATPLHRAAFNGHNEVVKALVTSVKTEESRLDVINKPDNDGFTPLHVAAQKGHKEVVTALLENGANINQANNNGFTPLFIAAEQGHTETIEALLSFVKETDRLDVINKPDNDGFTPLHVAAYGGHNEVVTALLASVEEENRLAVINQARSSDGITPLLIAADGGHDEVVKALLTSVEEEDKVSVINQARSSDGATPLYVAAQNGHDEVVTALLEFVEEEHRLDVINKPDNDGFTPLFIAAQNGHDEVVTALLAPVEKEKDKLAVINQADKNGTTPLLIAAERGHTETIEALLSFVKETDRLDVINKPDNGGFIPLHVAAQNGHKEVVKALLTSVKKETDRLNVINQADKNGFTPFLIAVQKGHNEVVTALLEKGADPNLATLGSTHLYIAAYNGHNEVVTAMKEFIEKNKETNPSQYQKFMAEYKKFGTKEKIDLRARRFYQLTTSTIVTLSSIAILIDRYYNRSSKAVSGLNADPDPSDDSSYLILKSNFVTMMGLVKEVVLNNSVKGVVLNNLVNAAGYLAGKPQRNILKIALPTGNADERFDSLLSKKNSYSFQMMDAAECLNNPNANLRIRTGIKTVFNYVAEGHGVGGTLLRNVRPSNENNIVIDHSNLIKDSIDSERYRALDHDTGGVYYQFNAVDEVMALGNGNYDVTLLSIHNQEQLQAVTMNNGASVQSAYQDQFGYYHLVLDAQPDLSYLVRVPTQAELPVAQFDPTTQTLIDLFSQNVKKSDKQWVDPNTELLRVDYNSNRDWLADIFDSGRGACRDRVKAFVRKLQEADIDPDTYRVVEIDRNHVAMEIRGLAGNWHYVGLGGVAAQLVDAPDDPEMPRYDRSQKQVGVGEDGAQRVESVQGQEDTDDIIDEITSLEEDLSSQELAYLYRNHIVAFFMALSTVTIASVARSMYVKKEKEDGKIVELGEVIVGDETDPVVENPASNSPQGLGPAAGGHVEEKLEKVIVDDEAANPNLARIELLPTSSTKIKAINSISQVATASNSKPLLVTGSKTAQAANKLITIIEQSLASSTKFKVPNSLSEVTTASNGNKNSKSLLVTGSKTAQAASKLIFDASNQGRAVFYIDDPSKIDIFDNAVTLQDPRNPKISQRGFLAEFLAKSRDQQPLILVNWDAFSLQKQVALNTALDDMASIQGQSLEGFKIVSLVSKAPTDKSFLSRHQEQFELDSEVNLELPSPEFDPTADIPKTEVIDFEGHINWRQKLFGDIKLSQGQLKYQQSNFVDLLSEDKYSFEFKNIPANAKAELQYQLQQAKAFGDFSYQGKKIAIPPELEVRFATVSFDFTQFGQQDQGLAINIINDVDISQLDAQANNKNHIINTRNFDKLLHGKKIEGEDYTQVPGLVELTSAAADKKLDLFITSQLSEEQYYCLFNQAKKHGVELNISLAPNVEITKDIAEQLGVEVSGKAEQESSSSSSSAANIVTEDGISFNDEDGLEILGLGGVKEVNNKLTQITVTNDANQHFDQLRIPKSTIVLDVEDYSYADLVEKIDYTLTGGQFKFSKTTSQLITKLAKGRPVILKGQISEELLLDLQEVLLQYPNLTIIHEERDIDLQEAAQQFSWLGDGAVQVAVRYADNILIQKVATETDPLGANPGPRNTMEGQVPSQIKTEASRFIATRKRNLTNLLSSSIVRLTGPSGVGKSSLMRDLHQDDSNNATVHNELSSLAAWAKDQDESRQKILFIDEANIDDMHYTMFAPLLRAEATDTWPATILHDGELIDLTKQHKVVFAGNPISYGGGRNEQKLFTDYKVPTFEMQDFKGEYIYQTLIKEAIFDKVNLKESTKNKLQQGFLKKCQEFILKYLQANARARDEGKADQAKTVRELQGYALDYLATAITKESKALALQKTPESSSYITTSATKPIEEQINKCLTIRKLQQDGILPVATGLGGIFLEGGSGIGKSSIIEAMISNEDHIKIDASIPAQQKIDRLTNAFKQGKIVQIDELNSCIDDGLEKALNAALTGHNPRTGQPAETPGFLLLASANKASMAGRSIISPALRHRMHCPEVPELSKFTQQDIEAMVNFWSQHPPAKTVATTGQQEITASQIAAVFHGEINKGKNLRDLKTAFNDMQKDPNINILQENKRTDKPSASTYSAGSATPLVDRSRLR